MGRCGRTVLLLSLQRAPGGTIALLALKEAIEIGQFGSVTLAEEDCPDPEAWYADQNGQIYVFSLFRSPLKYVKRRHT